MEKLTCVSGKTALSDWKPRLYFCCHPGDFSDHFDPIRDLIFKDTVCDIYYKETPTEPIPRHQLEEFLGDMNLFIVPVSMALLSRPCPAMEREIPFAREHHIPILPLFVSPGIHSAYNLPHKFGDTPYLDLMDPQEDLRSIQEKLRFHLEALLPSPADVLFTETTLRLHGADIAPLANALSCLFGINRPRDPKAALALLTKCAQFDDQMAIDYLYRMYDRGIGVATDLPTAVSWATRLVTVHRKTEKLELDRLNYIYRLAKTYMRLGEDKFALSLADKLYKSFRALLGDTNKHTVRCLRLRAELCRDTVDFFQLLTVQKRLYHLSVRLNGENAPETLMEQFRLALAYDSVGDKDEFLEILTLIQRQLVEQGLENTAFYLTVLYRIASQARQLERYDGALKLADQCYQLHSVCPQTHAYTALCALQLRATILCETNRRCEALRLKRRICNRYRLLLGPLHPDTLNAHTFLALHYNTDKRYDLALRHAKLAYDGYDSFYGPDFVRTKVAKNIYERIKKSFDENQ